MASQPLAFGELLLGGVLVTSAIRDIPLREFLKQGLKGTPEVTNKEVAGAVAGFEGIGNAAAAGVGPSAPPPSSSGQSVYESEKHNLEKYLKRKLTPKEERELHSLQSKGEL
jgi:hypothetical protein